MKAGEGEFYAQLRMRLRASTCHVMKQKTERNAELCKFQDEYDPKNRTTIRAFLVKWCVTNLSEARGNRGIKTFRKYGWNNLVTIVHFNIFCIQIHFELVHP